MKKNSRTLLVVGIAAVVIIVIAILARTKEKNTDTGSIGVAVVAVEVAPLAESSMSEIVAATGTVSAWRDVIVSSETSGRVTGTLVKVGDAVKFGQVLVRVDDELKTIGVEQSKAQLLAAEVNLNKAEKDFQRAEKLYASKDIADVELDGNRLGLRAAEAQYKSAQVGLKYAQKQLDDSQIKAPVSGIIASRLVEVGEMVGPGKAIANIVDMNRVKIRLSIPEEEIVRLRPGQKAVVRADADALKEISGIVYTVGTKSETQTGHSYPVEVAIDGTEGRSLKAGMFVRSVITVQTIQHALSISKEQLVPDAESPSVYVVENGIVHLRSVTLGIRSTDRYQIIGGVQRGEQLISFGLKNVKDGTRVAVSAK
ncbi:MAG: efflux RND transporter periplasmic adaptor subunit [Ignavibacteriales bacterium]|nr:efflux RND transporter periplasmic adaptor subunit [Ignavibacteriales bacterium]